MNENNRTACDKYKFLFIKVSNPEKISGDAKMLYGIHLLYILIIYEVLFVHL